MTMNDNELQFAFQIKRNLDQTVARLPTGHAERLRAARERAVAVQRRTNTVVVAAAVGAPSSFSFTWLGRLAPIGALVVGLVAINYWHETERAAEIAEIDVQMLLDELPPNAYLDKGFGAWVGRAPE